tara:strand:+ start:348 stop:884 length:537 start_codon:yes stop_codon:yes gene_type:complete
MALIHIASVTASASATVSFTSGIDATYNEYQFYMVNLNPATDAAEFTFQVNAAGQSGFNETMTTTVFTAYHAENDAYSNLGYNTASDQAQGTAYQPLSRNTANNADSGVTGILTLYAPSSTTYVKHFVSRAAYMHEHDDAWDVYVAGYINTTSAIDEISFKFSSGNIDAGTIHMYGVG